MNLSKLKKQYKFLLILTSLNLSILGVLSYQVFKTKKLKVGFILYDQHNELFKKKLNKKIDSLLMEDRLEISESKQYLIDRIESSKSLNEEKIKEEEKKLEKLKENLQKKYYKYLDRRKKILDDCSKAYYSIHFEEDIKSIKAKNSYSFIIVVNSNLIEKEIDGAIVKEYKSPFIGLKDNIIEELLENSASWINDNASSFLESELESELDQE